MKCNIGGKERLIYSKLYPDAQSAFSIGRLPESRLAGPPARWLASMTVASAHRR